MKINIGKLLKTVVKAAPVVIPGVIGLVASGKQIVREVKKAGKEKG